MSFFIVVLLWTATGFAAAKPDYKQLYEKLLKQYNSLKTENANLKKQIASLQNQVKLLNQKVASMPKEYEYDLVKDDVTISEKLPFISYKGRRYVHFDSIITTFYALLVKIMYSMLKKRKLKYYHLLRKKKERGLLILNQHI